MFTELLLIHWSPQLLVMPERPSALHQGVTSAVHPHDGFQTEHCRNASETRRHYNGTKKKVSAKN